MSWQRLGRSVSPGSGIDAEGLEAEYLAAAARALSPDPERLARVRRSLVAEFRVAAARSAAADQVQTSRGRVWLRSPRPAVALALGLALVIGSVGVVAAESTPGRPFYGLRLGLESLMLPASGRPERLDAQIARLERRLVEAEQATTFGDSIAASDAIAAYRSELGDAGAELADANGPRLGQVLAGHAIFLAQLGTGLSGPAKSSTDEALDQVNRLRQTIDGQPGGPPSDKPGKSGGNRRRQWWRKRKRRRQRRRKRRRQRWRERRRQRWRERRRQRWRERRRQRWRKRRGQPPGRDAEALAPGSRRIVRPPSDHRRVDTA